MVDIQEYLNQHYPQEERKNIIKLKLGGIGLTGELDLSDFINLRELDLSEAKINDFGTLIVQTPSAYDKYIPNHINFSFKTLRFANNIEVINLMNAKGNYQDLEYLPLDNLKKFHCHLNNYKEILKPYDYDLYAWKLDNYTDLVEGMDNLDNCIAELNKIIEKDQQWINQVNRNPRHGNWRQKYVKTICSYPEYEYRNAEAQLIRKGIKIALLERKRNQLEQEKKKQWTTNAEIELVRLRKQNEFLKQQLGYYQEQPPK